MTTVFGKFRPQSLVQIGTILFSANVAFAYAMYPHWVTLSHFAERWYTLIPFVFAMLIAMLELWYVADRLRRHGGLVVGANFLYASAVLVGLVICIPYLGTTAQKDVHNIIALLFALSAASGFVILAKQLRNYPLGILSGAIFGICVLELIFLARYNTHPVHAWVWTVLELTVIVSLITALDTIAVILEQKAKHSRYLKPPLRTE